MDHNHRQRVKSSLPVYTKLGNVGQTSQAWASIEDQCFMGNYLKYMFDIRPYNMRELKYFSTRLAMKLWGFKEPMESCAPDFPWKYREREMGLGHKQESRDRQTSTVSFKLTVEDLSRRCLLKPSKPQAHVNSQPEDSHN